MSGVDAGRELCCLLGDPARPYRQLWELRGAAYRGRPLNQSSIAKVVAAHLVDRGLLAEFEESDWPRARRDWIRSRLAGEVLTHLDLELFMDAFDLQEHERDTLRHHLEAGLPAPEPEAFDPDRIRLTGLPDRSAYAVDRILDEHTIGPAGTPVHHRTTQTIRALTAEVTQYLYLCDAEKVTVEVVKGGTADDPRRVAEGIWGVVITLDGPLTSDETCELMYDTTFDYDTSPTPELRRSAVNGRGEIEMSVSFHPDRLPAGVQQCTWAQLADDECTTSAVVELDHAHSVAATWTVVRAGMVGFTWQW